MLHLEHFTSRFTPRLASYPRPRPTPASPPTSLCLSLTHTVGLSTVSEGDFLSEMPSGDASITVGKCDSEGGGGLIETATS